MDISKIQAAITAMPSTKVQGGKTYSMVAQRVEAFRKNVGAELGIDTELLVDDGKRVLIKARIRTPDGFTVASGYAEEIRGSSNINRGAAIENCETSAVGRALAALGLHGGEYASQNEIEKHGRNLAAGTQPLPRHETKEKEYQPSYDSPPLNVNDLHKWDLWAQAQKDEMQGMNKLYELQRWEQKSLQDRQKLKAESPKILAEIKSYYSETRERLNTGER